jgi:hypothetical protein
MPGTLAGPFVQAGCGTFGLYTLDAAGVVTAYGRTFSSAVGPVAAGTNVADIPAGLVASGLAMACGFGHCCVISSSGSPECWGSDYNGQVTNAPNTVAASAYLPAKLGSASTPTDAPPTVAPPTVTPPTVASPTPTASPATPSGVYDADYSATGADLTEPPIYESTNGHLELSLTLAAFYYDGPTAQFPTRAFNGGIPSPTWKVHPGDTIRLTLVNELGANPDVAVVMNTFHEPNTTNMHTHGLHISGESPGDDVFRKCEPGQTEVRSASIDACDVCVYSTPSPAQSSYASACPPLSKVKWTRTRRHLPL